MIFYHLIVRLAVLPADLPQHDFHHRYPGTEKWTSAAYARSEEVSYFECWGLHRALAYTFENLERGALWTQISEAA